MSRKVVADVDDIEQLRQALRDLIKLGETLGWSPAEIAAWLALEAEQIAEKAGATGSEA